MARTWRRYRVFGLRIASTLSLPELVAAPADAGEEPDVVIERGDRARGVGDAAVLDLPAARYLIEAGVSIIVAPANGATALDVRLGLLGGALGILCHQRGLLALHAGAVRTARGAVVLAGRSGIGKSTLTARLQARGRAVLCDDLCVVSFDDAGRPLAWPGVARIKLWPDSLRALGLDEAALGRVATGQDKRSLPIRREGADGATPLGRFYELRDGSRVGGPPTPRRLAGAEAAAAVLASVYRWPLAADAGRAQGAFDAALTLAGRIDVFAVDGFDADAVDALMAHIES